MIDQGPQETEADSGAGLSSASSEFKEMPAADGTALPGSRMRLSSPIQLDCGVELGPITVAYQTYGTLN